MKQLLRQTIILLLFCSLTIQLNAGFLAKPVKKDVIEKDGYKEVLYTVNESKIQHVLIYHNKDGSIQGIEQHMYSEGSIYSNELIRVSIIDEPSGLYSIEATGRAYMGDLNHDKLIDFVKIEPHIFVRMPSGEFEPIQYGFDFDFQIDKQDEEEAFKCLQNKLALDFYGRRSERIGNTGLTRGGFAYLKLSNHPDARELFLRLFRHSLAAGKFYSLIYFYNNDRKVYDELKTQLSFKAETWPIIAHDEIGLEDALWDLRTNGVRQLPEIQNTDTDNPFGIPSKLDDALEFITYPKVHLKNYTEVLKDIDDGLYLYVKE